MNLFHTPYGEVAISHFEAERWQRDTLLLDETAGDPYFEHHPVVIMVSQRRAEFLAACERAALAKNGARFKDGRPRPMLVQERVHG